MKRLLGLLLALASFSAFGQLVANEVQITQRNPTNTAFLVRALPVPAAGANGIFWFNGSTALPGYVTLGPNLSISSGVLDAIAGAQTDWNLVSGPGSILNKPALASVATSGAYADLSGRPSLATVATTGAYADLSGRPSLFDGTWASLTGKPSTFPPSAHTHVATDISDSTSTGRNVLTAADATTARTAIGAGTSSFSGAYSALTGVPSTFPPSAHTHVATDISDSTSTGRSLLTATDAAAARTAIGAGTSSFSGAYSALSGIPSTFAPAAHTQAFSTITSTPTTLAGYGVTDAYPLTGNPSGFLTGITSGQVTIALGFTPYNATNPSAFVTQAGARSAVSLTTTGTSGAATYNSSTGVLNVPVYPSNAGTVTSVTAGTGLSGGTITSTGTISMPSTGTPGTYSSVTTDAQGRVTAGTSISINDSPGRTLVSSTASTGFQISSTRTAHVCYEGSFATTSTIGGPATATVFLETADTNSTTPGDWTTKAHQTYSNTITLAVVLNQVQGNNWAMCRYIPAAKFVRLRVGGITGTASASINTDQQEALP